MVRLAQIGTVEVISGGLNVDQCRCAGRRVQATSPPSGAGPQHRCSSDASASGSAPTFSCSTGWRSSHRGPWIACDRNRDAA